MCDEAIKLHGGINTKFRKEFLCGRVSAAGKAGTQEKLLVVSQLLGHMMGSGRSL